MNSDAPLVHCKNCGEQNLRKDKHCRNCHALLGEVIKRQPHRPKPTLVTTEILIATMAILLTVGMAASELWGLAIVMWIILLPVGLAIRTISRKKFDSQTKGTGVEKLGVYSSSIFVTTGCIVAVILATGIGFFLACGVGFFSAMALVEGVGGKGYDSLQWGFITGCVTGGIVGLFIAYRLIRQFWWRKKNIMQQCDDDNRLHNTPEPNE